MEGAKEISAYEKNISHEMNDSIDRLQSEMMRHEQIGCPLDHRFTEGLYSRKITMPPDSLIVSKIHKKQHQFAVLKGVAYVKINDTHWERIEAGHTGITEPGTRRILYIPEDSECIWVTYHPTDKKTVKDVEEEIIEKHDLSHSIENQ